jgi:hypothetical protein
MIRKVVVLGTSGVALILACLTTPIGLSAHEEIYPNVVYRGDDSARHVCMSIVHDDVSGLRRAFRNGKNQRMERSHLAYRCNEMALDEFAFTQNADQVSSYLAPQFGHDKGQVTIEQVGSIEH